MNCKRCGGPLNNNGVTVSCIMCGNLLFLEPKPRITPTALTTQPKAQLPPVQTPPKPHKPLPIQAQPKPRKPPTYNTTHLLYLPYRTRGRPRTGEYHECVDCGKEIYLRKSFLEQPRYKGVRCKQCNSTAYLPPVILRHGDYSAKNPCNHDLQTRKSFKVCLKCGEIRKLATKPPKKDPIILKRYP